MRSNALQVKQCDVVKPLSHRPHNPAALCAWTYSMIYIMTLKPNFQEIRCVRVWCFSMYPLLAEHFKSQPQYGSRAITHESQSLPYTLQLDRSIWITSLMELTKSFFCRKKTSTESVLVWSRPCNKERSNADKQIIYLHLCVCRDNALWVTWGNEFMHVLNTGLGCQIDTRLYLVKNLHQGPNIQWQLIGTRARNVDLLISGLTSKLPLPRALWIGRAILPVTEFRYVEVQQRDESRSQRKSCKMVHAFNHPFIHPLSTGFIICRVKGDWRLS